MNLTIATYNYCTFLSRIDSTNFLKNQFHKSLILLLCANKVTQKFAQSFQFECCVTRNYYLFAVYLTEVELRTQGSRPSPRTQKNPRPRPRTAHPRTDPLAAKDKNVRGQGQGPRTQAQAFSKKEKRSSKFFFMLSPIIEEHKKGLRKFSERFMAFSTKFQRFKNWCCPPTEDRAIFEDVRL